MRIKLVVGLGNPGKKYENTRHNIGFMVLDKIAEKLNIPYWKEKDNALYYDEFVGIYKVIFLKPQSYINLSGDVMIKFVKYFDIKTEDIIVVCDDLDTPVGGLRIKEKGTSGGHNGLKNIEQNLKTTEYKRVKLGISNNKEIDTKDYVLGTLSAKDKKIIKPLIDKAADAVLKALEVPFDEVMSKYNTKVKNNVTEWYYASKYI